MRQNAITLLDQLRIDFPNVSFRGASTFYWSPKERAVFFNPTKTDDKSQWALLHELSHALLGHRSYKTDFNLLQLETLAWEHAQKLATNYKVNIDHDHIQDCLDSYRNWLYARSTCPVCTECGVEKASQHYVCVNCHNEWNVSSSRFCRSYRRLYKQKGLPV